MNFKIKLFLTAIIFFTNACSQKAIVINPFMVLNRTDTTKHNGQLSLNRSEYFLVEQYHDIPEIQHYIDGYIASRRQADYKSYDQYNILLYQKSDKTNLKGNQYGSNNIDKYANQEDLILVYIWYKGRFALKNRYKDGQFVPEDNNKITIKDIK